MDIRPLHDQVLVRVDEAPEKSAGGIYLPDSYYHGRGDKDGAWPGEVIAVGPGAVNRKGVLIPTIVKPGDRVFFMRIGGKWLDDRTEAVGDTYVTEDRLKMIPEDLICVILEDEKAAA